MDKKEVLDALKQAKDEAAHVTRDTRSPKFSLQRRVDMCIMNTILLLQKGKLCNRREWRKVTRPNFFVKEPYVMAVKSMLVSLVACLVRPGHPLLYVVLFNGWLYSCHCYNKLVLRRKRQTHPLEVLGLVTTLSFVYLTAMEQDHALAEALIYGAGLSVLDWIYRLFDYLYRQEQ